jgi:SAM-dependent MidA family methyltransferase
VADLWAESDADLVELIRGRIESAGGRITFAEFMDLALYHPEHGYYRGPTVRSAREGDFLTAAELHPIFGRVVSGQLTEMWELMERPAPFTVREYGAGPGTLGLTVLEGLRAEGSELLGQVIYEPIEINAAHRATLDDRFAAAGLGDRLVAGSELVALGEPPTKGRVPTDGPTDGRIIGVIIASEFIDAFPVHRIEGMAGGGLRERFVTWRDGWFVEEAAEPSRAELAATLARVGIELAPGQQAEVNLAMGAWLDDVAAALERGYVLVVDYGYPAKELYGAERAGGTLRAYHAHTAHGDPFRFVGRQDLTAHVDFTTLARGAEARGLDTLALTTQAAFLVEAGLERVFAAERDRPDLEAEAYLTLRASVVRLLDPRALGGFRVLLLGRGVPTDRLPSGFPAAGPS